jgi:hypothetical protein
VRRAQAIRLWRRPARPTQPQSSTSVATRAAQTHEAAIGAGTEEAMTRTGQRPSPAVVAALTGSGVAIGVVVAMLTSDVIQGVMAGALLIAIAVGLVRLWTGGGTRRSHHT